jgi:hypothetical protein
MLVKPFHHCRFVVGRIYCYGKQLLDHIQWRQECAAKVGLGFTLPKESNEPLLDKSGQVFATETEEVVLA